MEFLFFIATAPDGEPDVNESAEAWVDELEARGARLYGNRLRPAAEATVVTVRGGDVRASAGPISSAPDVIAGFDVIECDDLEAAIAIASAHPMARSGQIEIRAVWPFDEA